MASLILERQRTWLPRLASARRRAVCIAAAPQNPARRLKPGAANATGMTGGDAEGIVSSTRAPAPKPRAAIFTGRAG